MDIEDIVLIGAAMFAYGIAEVVVKEIAQHLMKPWKGEEVGAEDRRDVAKLASDAIHWLHEHEDEIAELQEWKKDVEARLAALEEGLDEEE